MHFNTRTSSMNLNCMNPEVLSSSSNQDTKRWSRIDSAGIIQHGFGSCGAVGLGGGGGGGGGGGCNANTNNNNNMSLDSAGATMDHDYDYDWDESLGIGRVRPAQLFPTTTPLSTKSFEEAKSDFFLDNTNNTSSDFLDLPQTYPERIQHIQPPLPTTATTRTTNNNNNNNNNTRSRSRSSKQPQPSQETSWTSSSSSARWQQGLDQPQEETSPPTRTRTRPTTPRTSAARTRVLPPQVRTVSPPQQQQQRQGIPFPADSFPGNNNSSWTASTSCARPRGGLTQPKETSWTASLTKPNETNWTASSSSSSPSLIRGGLKQPQEEETAPPRRTRTSTAPSSMSLMSRTRTAPQVRTVSPPQQKQQQKQERNMSRSHSLRELRSMETHKSLHSTFDSSFDDSYEQQQRERNGKIGAGGQDPLEVVYNDGSMFFPSLFGSDDDHDNNNHNHMDPDFGDAPTTASEYYLKTKKRNHKVVWGLLIGLTIGLLVGLLIAFVGPNSKHQHQKELQQSQAQAQRGSPDSNSDSCVPGEIADLNTALVTLRLEGLSRLATSEEEIIIEQAVMDAYNEVSGGCEEDVYERWMYAANLVNQIRVVQEDTTGAIMAKIETTISSDNDCPNDEIFASEYLDVPAKRSLISRVVPKNDASSRHHRHLQTSNNNTTDPDINSTVINAGNVIRQIEQNLKTASDNGLIEAEFTGISETAIENEKSETMFQVSTPPAKKNPDEDKPPKSNTKTEPPSPTSSPTQRYGGQTGKGGKASTAIREHSSKTPSPSSSHSPSLSTSPSSSVVPSASPSRRPSVRPSLSAEPSKQPPTRPSKQPSSQPSKLPSSQPSKLPSSLPSSQPSTMPSKSSVPSRQPSDRPSKSAMPSSLPSSEPSMGPSMTIQ